MFGRQFRVIPQAMAFFQTKQFALLPPSSFLTLLSSKPVNITQMSLELEQEDFEIFQRLQRGLACIKEAMTLFRKRNLKGKVKAPQGDSGEE